MSHLGATRFQTFLFDDARSTLNTLIRYVYIRFQILLQKQNSSGEQARALVRRGRMIPHRYLGRSPDQRLQDNLRTSLPSEADLARASVTSGAVTSANASLGMNLPHLRTALHSDIGSSLLSQQLRLYQANQELLLAARREQEQGLSMALQNFNHQQVLQNEIGPQLFNPMNPFSAVHHGMGLKTSMIRSPFQRENLLAEAYQRGKEGLIRSILQQRGVDTQAPQRFATMQAENMSALTNILDASINASAPQPFASLETPAATRDFVSNRVDASADALEELGTKSIERRMKNAPYFDASSLKDPDPVGVSSRRTRGGVTEPFPEKLHRMIREVEEDGQDDVIAFLSHGRAFAIHQPDKFIKEVMPKYFKQSRLSSFQRQLNLYGFTRVTVGPDAGAYYHELFLKGRPALATHMRRVGVTSVTNNQRLVRPIGNTPDFYLMKPVQGSDPEAKAVTSSARSA